MVLITLVTNALIETLWIVFASTIVGSLLGIPLGVLLYKNAHLSKINSSFLNLILNFIVNSLRSVPYIILTVLMIPLTKVIMGTTIGTNAAIIPLSLAATLLIARATEDSLKTLPNGLTELGISLGAKPYQIIYRILLPEALPSLLANLTTIIINLIGFSAMAGTVGGGGLGDLAIRYGYQRYDTTLMIIIVLILIALVQFVQVIGHLLIKKSSH